MVCIEDEVEINAALEKVWEAFTDLTCWADWNSVLTNVQPHTGNCIDADGQFTCCVTPFLVPVFFETRIVEISPMERIVWTGSKYMIHGRHEFLFTEKGGKVRLFSKEVLSGPPVAFGGIFFPLRKFRALTREFLEGLRKYAEDST
jgi:uncharacterized protein YndB with AHSA1/START domain